MRLVGVGEHKMKRTKRLCDGVSHGRIVPSTGLRQPVASSVCFGYDHPFAKSTPICANKS